MADLRPSSLRLDTVSGAGKSVVIVRGRDQVDIHRLGQGCVDGLLDDVTVIELDLTEVGFLDSTGIGVMAAALRRLEPVDGRLELSSVPAQIIRLLSITDLLRFVTVLSEQEP